MSYIGLWLAKSDKMGENKLNIPQVLGETGLLET